MKKIFKIKNLDCAVCASKMEKLIKKIKGINECSVVFLSGKLMIELDDYNNDIFYEIVKAVKKVDSNCEVL